MTSALFMCSYFILKFYKLYFIIIGAYMCVRMWGHVCVEVSGQLGQLVLCFRLRACSSYLKLKWSNMVASAFSN